MATKHIPAMACETPTPVLTTTEANAAIDVECTSYWQGFLSKADLAERIEVIRGMECE
jgi:hypothetical protein